MIQAVILFAVGLALICFGGDRLVDASVAIAKKLGIPQIVVGATIVSVGTTLPEVLVSTTAAFQGSADICAGNAFGSIICNTALIAGLTQAIRPIKKIETSSLSWRTAFFMITIAAMGIYGVAFGRFDRMVGLVLLAGFVLYAILSIRLTNSQEDEEQADEINLGKKILTLIVCAGLLFVGAKLLVNNGIIIAEGLHVPERIIAVTFIALGTSLPELITSLMSIIKGYGNVGLGNIIGANLLNLFLVIGIPASITGIQLADQTIRMDIPVGIIVMLVLTLPIIIKKRVYRWQGILLLAMYTVYCIVGFMIA